MPPTEHELAERSRRGDLDAYGELVRLHQGGVFSVCYRLLGERADAEDAAQETFLRAYENASLGTDHGHGALMMLLGGGVHGRWPGMEREQLFGPGDLAVTTDYRDVLAEVCLKRLNNPDLAAVLKVGEILKPRSGGTE